MASRPAGGRTRVVLADDHPIVRAGLRYVLERDGAIEVTGEAGDGRTLLRVVRGTAPDVVIVDVSMPDLNGIDAIRALKRTYPAIRILVVSVHCSEAIVRDALAAGAAGYVVKEAASDELRTAVEAVARGQGYLSPQAVHLVTCTLSGQGVPRPILTSREREVIQLIGEGQSAHEIAAKLFVSVATVKTHRANAMRKLGARNTADLVRHALRIGLTSA